MVTFATTLYSSTLTASGSVNNNGAGTAYPKWTITGPCRSATFVNTTTGETLAVDYEVGAKGVLTIDCDPVRQTVVDQDGHDLSAYVRTGSTFWGFGGLAVVPFTIQVDWTSALSSVVLTWHPS